jgi:Spy/CpxP family protein refolding chaperone
LSRAERREKVRLVRATGRRAVTKPSSADLVGLRCFQLADARGGVGRPGRREEAQPTAGWESGPYGIVLWDKEGLRRCLPEGRRWVMKNLITMSMVAAVMCLAPKLFAEERPAGLAERLQDLTLTDDQEAKIAQIRKEGHPEVQKAAKELAAVVNEELEKVQAVLTPEQKEKLQELKAERKRLRGERLVEQLAHLHELDLTEAERTKIAEIRKEFQPKVAKAMEDLKDILTPEQRKAREEGLKAGKPRREILDSLKLTEVQKEKVEAVGKEVHGIVKQELGKVKDLLSEAQIAKVTKLAEERAEHVRDWMAHRVANLKELNLSDEVKSKISSIRKEYMPKVHDAGNKLRAAIRDEVHKIHAALGGGS